MKHKDIEQQVEQELAEWADAVLARVSFATTHYNHGKAVGINDRVRAVDSSSCWANEFLDGYQDGWLQMDEAIWAVLAEIS